MKKILVGIAFFIILVIFKTARTVQAATTDLSKNFTAMHISTKRRMSVFNDDFVHVQADFSDQHYPIKSDSSMIIAWKNNSVASIQGIPEKRSLIAEDDHGKEYEVGQYTVTKDGVLVTFNEDIEDFKNIAGEIDFDIQIKNPTKNSQNLFIHAGDLSKKLHVVGQFNPVSTDVLADLNGKYDKQNNEISWEIKINPLKTRPSTIQVSNDIPSGLLLDRESVEAETNNKKIKLNKENVEMAKDSLKLYFDNKDYADQRITVRYKTQVIDENAVDSLNQVVVGYLKDGKIINKNIYGGKIQNGNNKRVVATVLNLESSEKDQKVRGRRNERRETEESEKSRYLKFYHEVMDLLFKGKRDKSDLKDELKQKDIDKTKSISLPNTSSALRLTGFDSTPTPLAETRVSKADKTKNISKVLDEDSDLDEKLSKANTKENTEQGDHIAEHNSKKLPKAGESAPAVLIAIGLIILGIGLAAFKLNLKK